MQYSRRFIVQGGLLLAGAARTPLAFAAALTNGTQPGRGAKPTAIVRTPSGSVLGEQQDSDVRVFRGIPFAEPPQGDLRFRAPVTGRVVVGELNAMQFGAEPWQTGTPNVQKSEDCLQLNVWTPNDAKPGSLPVFVWIHGGGFTGGRAFDPTCDGAVFARDGVVCVTVAYRLGVFGFLDMGSLLGPTYDGSANNALRDLMLALHWVQANIAAFGGDPARVTIGGESAGAKLCDILMGVPAAQSLFHAVISESGGAERVWSQASSRAVAEGFGNTWQASSGQTIAALKTAQPSTIIDAQERLIREWPQHFPLRCELDGTLLQRLPIDTIRAGSSRGKRLLLGTNRDESALFLGPHPAHNPSAADLGNLSLATFAPMDAKYAALYPELSVEQRRIRAVTAEEYWVPSMRVAAAHAKNGGPAWVYRLDYATTVGRFAGYAFHSEDVELVWNRAAGPIEDRSAEVALAAQMHAAWVAFIHGDTPAANGLPSWPQWTPEDRKTMLLDRVSTVAVRPQEAELRLWNGVL